MTTPLRPVRRKVEVATDAARAFELWTAHIAAWWPMGSHSVHGEHSTVAFVDHRLIETAPDGSTETWGTVTAWEPPHLLAMTWHPGRDASEATHLEVRFETIGPDRSLVTLEHSGWEVLAEPERMRANYETGWAIVMTPFVTAAQVTPWHEAKNQAPSPEAKNQAPSPEAKNQAPSPEAKNQAL